MFRVIVGSDVAAMMVVRGDFSVVATEEETEMIVSISNQGSPLNTSGRKNGKWSVNTRETGRKVLKKLLRPRLIGVYLIVLTS